MKKKRGLCFLLTVMLLFSFLFPITAQASTVRLSKKTLTLEIGKSAILRMQGTDKAIKWSSKDKEIAMVSTTGKVTAKQAGTTSIYAKVGKKQYACEVTVLPEFQMDEESLAGELDGRMLEINGQSFRISEDEIGEVKILSRSRSKDNQYLQIKAQIEIDRTIALLSSKVTLLYRNTSKRWKLSRVTATTEVEEWNLEGIWTGGVEVYDYSRNTSESRELTLDIFDVKEDGVFDCEATLTGTEVDVISVAGELNEETGEVELIGLNWIDATSALAKDLSKRGKVYSFYAVPDFANDAFVAQDGISTRMTFTSDLLVEKEVESNTEDGSEEIEEEGNSSGWVELDGEDKDVEEEGLSEEETEEDMIYE